jgi:hypothetical protein
MPGIITPNLPFAGEMVGFSLFVAEEEEELAVCRLAIYTVRFCDEIKTRYLLVSTRVLQSLNIRTALFLSQSPAGWAVKSVAGNDEF